MSPTTFPPPESPAPARGRLPRIPLIAPDSARVVDLAEAAHAVGCRLVHDGRRVFLTPRVMPGEFVVGEAA